MVGELLKYYFGAKQVAVSFLRFGGRLINAGRCAVGRHSGVSYTCVWGVWSGTRGIVSLVIRDLRGIPANGVRYTAL